MNNVKSQNGILVVAYGFNGEISDWFELSVTDIEGARLLLSSRRKRNEYNGAKWKRWAMYAKQNHLTIFNCQCKEPLQSGSFRNR